eukprot:366416-Chlamydomonas_euryale.AAC.9
MPTPTERESCCQAAHVGSSTMHACAVKGNQCPYLSVMVLDHQHHACERSHAIAMPRPQLPRLQLPRLRLPLGRQHASNRCAAAGHLLFIWLMTLVPALSSR